MQFIFTSFETSASELDSPTDSVSSSQSHGPYVSFRTHSGYTSAFTKLSSQPLWFSPRNSGWRQTWIFKLSNGILQRRKWKTLDAFLSSGPGRSKLRTWMRQPVTVDVFCDVITQEMNNVQKVELLPEIAAFTPEFIKNWTISPHWELALAPFLLNVLSTAAQTTIAKEKNKIKEPDMVCSCFFFLFFMRYLTTYVQYSFATFCWSNWAINAHPASQRSLPEVKISKVLDHSVCPHW